MIAKRLDDKQLKKYVVSNLVAVHGLYFLEKYVDKKTFSILDKKYGKAFAIFEMYINNQIRDFIEVLYNVGYLSSLDAVARTATPPLNIKKSLLDDTDKEIIADLKKLCDVLRIDLWNLVLLKRKIMMLYLILDLDLRLCMSVVLMLTFL